jgi:hypothetical protein
MSHETTGMLSYQASSFSQDMQREAGFTIDWWIGTRAATTLRKLPIAIPGGSDRSAAVAAVMMAR